MMLRIVAGDAAAYTTGTASRAHAASMIYAWKVPAGVSAFSSSGKLHAHAHNVSRRTFVTNTDTVPVLDKQVDRTSLAHIHSSISSNHEKISCAA